MNSTIDFDCPRCNREYQLSMNLDIIRQSKRRAKCSRCGESFEIAARLDAIAASRRTPSAEISVSDILTVRPGTPLAASSALAVELPPPTHNEPQEVFDGIVPSVSGAKIAEVEVEPEPDLRIEPPHLDWLSIARLPLAALEPQPNESKDSILALLD